jgi:hypothetical protein
MRNWWILAECFAKKYMLEFDEVASSLSVNSTKTGEIVESIIAAKRSHHTHTFVSVILKEKKRGGSWKSSGMGN